jgi:hypothetical protein
MRKIFSLIACLSISGAAFAITNAAYGHGFVQVDDHVRAIFDFDVLSSGDRTAGYFRMRLATGEETLHVVGLPAVQRASFRRNGAEFAGPGILDGHRVGVRVRVFDGHGTDHLDNFEITCVGPDGHIALHLGGELAGGDIVVRHVR